MVFFIFAKQSYTSKAETMFFWRNCQKSNGKPLLAAVYLPKRNN